MQERKRRLAEFTPRFNPHLRGRTLEVTRTLSLSCVIRRAAQRHAVLAGAWRGAVRLGRLNLMRIGRQIMDVAFGLLAVVHCRSMAHLWARLTDTSEGPQCFSPDTQRPPGAWIFTRTSRLSRPIFLLHALSLYLSFCLTFFFSSFLCLIVLSRAFSPRGDSQSVPNASVTFLRFHTHTCPVFLRTQAHILTVSFFCCTFAIFACQHLL